MIDSEINNSHEKYQKEQEIFAEAIRFFVNVKSVDEIYNYIGKILKEEAGADYLLISIYDKSSHSLSLKLSLGFSDFVRNEINSIIGMDPRSIRICISDMEEEDKIDFVSHRLVKYKNGLYGLSNKKISKSLCKKIENFLGVKIIYNMGFSWNGNLYGGVTFLFKGFEIREPHFIEALINQTSIAIQKRLAEEARIESEEKYRLISEHMSDLICLYSIYMKPLYISPSIKEILGYAPEELKGKSPQELFPPDDFHILKISFEKLLTGDNIEPLEHRIMSKNGDYIWFETIVKPVIENGKIVRILTSSRNITERKKMENNLIEEIEFNRQMILSAQEGIIVYDSHLKYVEWNPYMEKLTGLKSEEVIGWAPEDIFPFFKEFGIMEKLRQALNGETVTSGDICLYTQRTGRRCWTSAIYAPLRDAGNDIIGVIGTVRDITEQKSVEELLWIKNFAIESSINGIIMMDLTGKLTYVNHSFLKLWKYDSHENVIGEPYQILWQDSRKSLSVIGELYKSGKWVGEMVARGGDKKEFEVHVSAFTVNDKKGNPLCLMAIFMDITEKLNLEKNLRQSQKMEAIGNLAGGIAHDFNNILGTIFGYIEILIKEVPENSYVEQKLQKILNSAQRARDLVKQILAFSRKCEQEKKLVKASDVIEESIKFLRASLPSTIQITRGFEDNNSIIFADRTQIYQILMNLCLNSAHAMRERCGIITISLEDVFVSENDITSFDGLDIGPYVKLAVSDDGYGIKKDIIDRIFEPYFTTKKMDEGTGLGLSVVHGIVKSYGGDIKVYSEEGNGARFEIYLPRTEADNADDSGDLLPVKNGVGRILVVDDEIDLAEVSAMILMRLGYEVTTLSSSVEAFEVFKKDPHKFDLLITDQTMPYMTGDELAKNILSIRSNLPIILVTGFSEIINSETAKKSGIKEFILKPLTIRSLADAVEKVLEGY